MKNTLSDLNNYLFEQLDYQGFIRVLEDTNRDAGKAADDKAEAGGEGKAT